MCNVKSPFKMDGTIEWRFNDTVIINGEKIGPQDTLIHLPASDYYGAPSIN